MKKFLELERFEGECPHCRTRLSALWKCRISVDEFSKVIHFCTACNRRIKGYNELKEDAYSRLHYAAL